MKIAVLQTNFNLFGADPVVVTILDELLKLRHKIFLYTLTKFRKSSIRNINRYYYIEEDFGKIKVMNDFYFLQHVPYYRDYILRALPRSRRFDIIIDTNSNGFYPISNKKAKTICYVHFPMGIKPTSTFRKLCLFPIYNKIGHSYEKYDKIIINSNFTKKHLEKITSKEMEVIYPPVSTKYSSKDVKNLRGEKENLIITVGRLAPEKKLDFLIEQFKKIYNSNKNWEMHIIGAYYSHFRDYYEGMKKISNGYPIYFHKNVSRERLDDLYKRAKIYWHAKGYAETNPIMFEHFGITTVEAMNHGCIPIVINKGGQREIVDHEINGFRWNTEDELYAYTRKVMSEKVDVKTMGRAAIAKSRKFDESVFRRKIVKLIEEAM